MALEMVAARVLAPALGNSIFVWGSVISIVMIALSLGYWVGGQLADRRDASPCLARSSPRPGCSPCSRRSSPRRCCPGRPGSAPRWARSRPSALIFFLPALLLATVSPLSVRLAASRGLEHIGRSAGGLYAISTAGSVVGTLATAFWLIPLLSLEPLVVLRASRCSPARSRPSRCRALRRPGSGRRTDRARRTGARHRLGRAALTLGLVIAGGRWARGCSPTWRRSRPSTSGASAFSTAPTASTTGSPSPRPTTSGTCVSTQQPVRHRALGRLQSTIALPELHGSALAAKPDAKSVLVLGLGGGADHQALVAGLSGRDDRQRRDRPGGHRRLAAVLRAARGPAAARLQRGRAPLRPASTETYDIVIVDCYYADSLPFHLTTQEFFPEVKQDGAWTASSRTTSSAP